MQGAFCAFLDASVLYPVSLRNLLMRLTIEDLYQARWSAHVHEEWVRAVARDNPGSPIERLHCTQYATPWMWKRNALVPGYEDLIEALTLPDPNDRHVLAAAIVARADVIVTCNLRHFPEAALDPYDMEAQHTRTNSSAICSTWPRSLWSMRCVRSRPG